MKVIDFAIITKDITGKSINILILKNQDEKKWYQKEYEKTDEINENTVYGVSFDRTLQFDLRVGKIENLLKTFVTQYINKYLMTIEYIDENGLFAKHTKETAGKTLNNIHPRNGYLYAYSTNYGIGVHNVYVCKTTQKKVNDAIKEILTSSDIEFKNELSDALWVYRHKFSGSYLDHNLIIEEMKNKLQLISL